TMSGSGINSEADANAAQSQRVLHASGQGLMWIFFVIENVMVIDFQDQRDLSREIARARFQKSQRRSVGVAAGFNRQLEMVMRIVGWRIWAKASRRAMLKPLVHRQDHQLAGAGESAM